MISGYKRVLVKGDAHIFGAADGKGAVTFYEKNMALQGAMKHFELSDFFRHV